MRNNWGDDLLTIWFFLCFFLSLGITTLILPFWHFAGWLGAADAQRLIAHYTSYYWARFLLLMAGVRVKVSGLEHIPAGPVLFVSNHQSNFDIPVLLSHINKPKGFLAKIELAKVPVMRSWMAKMGCVFIDRSDMRQSIKAIQKCVEVVKGGQSMVIFPEGTRSKGPVMGEFKKGSLRLVEKAGVPVVPVTINGTYKAMEANQNRITPAKIDVHVSLPVYYDQMEKEEQERIGELLHALISKNLTAVDG